MTEREKMWAGVTVLVCIGAGAVAIVAAAAYGLVQAAAILGGWLGGSEYAAFAAGSLLALAGLFIAGWHSGKSFEREHGGRVCGAGPEIVDPPKPPLTHEDLRSRNNGGDTWGLWER